MADDAKKDVALRKRQQIEKAGRTMFAWVAIAAVIVGIAAVLVSSLIQQLIFNQKVIGEMNTTLGNLRDNNAAVEELKNNVRVLNTNQALLDTPRLNGAEPISAVLDALPSQANSAAFGASLEQKLLRVDGVSIEDLSVDPVYGVEDVSGDGASLNSTEELGENQIGFRFIISTDAKSPDKLRQVLTNLEQSIRPIDVTSVKIDQQRSRITMSVDGHTFYSPELKVELTKKSVKP